MDSKPTEKKIERISKLQKQKLVEYLSTNLEFARGQFSGVNSNSNYKEQWETLKMSLNCLGGSEKNVEQWKKCWADLKCGVKKTMNIRRKFINKNGGGSWVDVPRDLNPLEEQILQVITVDAVDGDSCTPESGVLYEGSFEEFASVEFLECEEVYTPSLKQSKITPSKAFPTTSCKALQNKVRQQQTTSSKYCEALDEAKCMQNALVHQLNSLEKQNEEI